MTVPQTTSSSSTISITSQGGFSEAVILSYSWFGDAPSDVTVDLPASVTPPPDGSARAEIRVFTSASASLGVFTLRVTGMSGSLTHQVDIAVTVTRTTTATSTSTVTLTQVNLSLVFRVLGENLGVIIMIALIILVLTIVAHVLLHLPPRQPTYY